MGIAEARARGASIPLDPRRIYLLAHPDKAPPDAAEEMKAKFADATAILNAQRPPEMTEVKVPVRKPAPAPSPPAPKSGIDEVTPAPHVGVDEVAKESKEMPSTNATTSTVTAPERKGNTADEEKRTAPEDGKLCSYNELCVKYASLY